MATVTQVLDMSRSQLDWVCEHLGHTFDVHRTNYRNRSDMLERLEVAKILLIQDTGRLKEFVGKRIEDIQFTDIVAENPEAHSQSQVALPVLPDDIDGINDVFDTIGSQEMDEDEDEESPTRKRKKRKRPTSVQRSKWSIEEEEELKHLFKENFSRGKGPCQKDCEKARARSKEKGGVIHKRPRDNIKKKVFNMLAKISS